MNVETNIKINYMILEQILRVTGTYKNLCNEHEFLDVVFKQAKTGDLRTLFYVKIKNEKGKDIKVFREDIRDATFERIANITGVSAKYWSGKERIKLGMRLKYARKNIVEDDLLNLDGVSIDTIDSLDRDKPPKVIPRKDEKTGKIIKKGYAYHGRKYQMLLRNPLHLERAKIYYYITGERKVPRSEVKPIISLYSLRGLLTVLLLNMAASGEIGLIDTANVYKRTKWEPYIRFSNKPTEHGIAYCPKYIEIRKGLVQTIIRNLYDRGNDFTYRDWDKEFKI